MLECLLCPCTVRPCHLYTLRIPPMSGLQGVDRTDYSMSAEQQHPTCSLLKVAILFRPLLILASGLPACPCCCGAGGNLSTGLAWRWGNL